MLIEGTCLGLVDRLFFLYCSENYRDLHSFPTRRSSDLYWMSAIRLDRFGSYSIRTTEAATPSFLFRLKSIRRDRKSTRLNSSHTVISYAVFCLKKKNHHDGAHDQPMAETHAAAGGDEQR